MSSSHKLSCLFTSLLCVATTSVVAGRQQKPTIELSPVTTFGIGTFKSLAAKSSENIFISPVSLHSCLLLSANGAAGVTADEMKRVLGFSTKTVAQANEYEHELLAQLRSNQKFHSSEIESKSDSGDITNSYPDSKLEAKSESNSKDDFSLQLANSIWLSHQSKLKPEFLDKSKGLFDAQVQALDFSSPKAADAINLWVNENTNGKIKEVAGNISADQKYMLVNAAYFKADWQNAFKAANTTDGDFHKSKGSDKKVSLMQATRSFNYLENKAFQAVELPYKDPDTSLLVFLPKKNDKIGTLVQSMTPATWQSWLNSMSVQTGTLKLPKFNVSYGTSCKPTLTQQGMKTAFSSEADFSGLMSVPSVGISDVLHRTFVKVDEKGTEAAAATTVTDRSLGMAATPTSKPFTMIVDHPFMIAVWNKKTQTLLFIGQITDPSAV